MDSIEAAVIGGGVVGLAVGRALAMQGMETLVFERHARPGQETTSRNSGVIHSGIYYPAGSLKATLCVQGRELLYSFCEARGIAHRRCGKIVVASESQVGALQALYKRGIGNGVVDLDLLDRTQVAQLEPAVACAAGLLSPSTGIIDVHELLLTLLADLESHGGALLLQAVVESAKVAGDDIVLQVRSGGATSELRCRWLINSAGLSAPQMLRLIEGYPPQRLRPAFYAKGSYFACQGVRPFKRLIYPLPNSAGLGIHATLELDGTTRFGPDVEWVTEPDYSVDPARAESFYAAIREYWPDLPRGSLQPAYAGVRPKLVGPASAAADFEIETRDAHGVARLINLLGIESPGLTASLAIAERVAGVVSADA